MFAVDAFEARMETSRMRMELFCSSAVARDCVHCGGYAFNEAGILAAPIGWIPAGKTLALKEAPSLRVRSRRTRFSNAPFLL